MLVPITTEQRVGMAKRSMGRWQAALGRAHEAWNEACDHDVTCHEENARIEYCEKKIQELNILLSNLDAGLA
jgi:hypothetical protein